jgi:hypothetical protein
MPSSPSSQPSLHAIHPPPKKALCFLVPQDTARGGAAHPEHEWAKTNNLLRGQKCAVPPQYAATTDITAALGTNHNAQDPSCRKNNNNNKDVYKDKRHTADLTMA